MQFAFPFKLLVHEIFHPAPASSLRQGGSRPCGRGPDVKVGFAGLGTMGAPMACRLKTAGFDVIGFDVDEGAVAAARAAGVAATAVLRDLSGSDVVVTMLPTGDAVREVLLDPALTPAEEAVFVDSSSADPLTTVGTGRDLAARGIALVDSPVSGDSARAAAGTLTLMVGGDDDAVARAFPVLDALGQVHRVGRLGAGHTMKALNNLLAAVNLAAAAEVMLAGRRHGLDPAVMLATLNRATGRNDATENKIGQFVLSRSFDSGFLLDLMTKDVEIALRLVESAATPGEIARACRRIWRNAARALRDGADNVEVVRWLEEQAEVTLEAGPPQSAGGR